MSEGGETLKIFFNLCQTIGRIFAPAVIPWFLYYILFKRRPNNDLKGKVFLITGASSGLGEQMAHAFYSKGAKLILAARRLDQLERVKNALLTNEEEGVTYPPELLQLDLSDLNSLQKRVNEALSLFGQIDILVNNAGISYRGEIVSTALDVDMKVMMVNYFGTIALVKAVLPSMISRKSGQIVAIGSVQARIGIPFRSAYGASKHALQSFMDCLRAELDGKGISVTVVNPGYINTNLSENALTADGQKYGVTDQATSSGYDPRSLAEEICVSVSKEEKEVTPAQLAPKVAILLRTVCPSLYFYVMARRARTN